MIRSSILLASTITLAAALAGCSTPGDKAAKTPGAQISGSPAAKPSGKSSRSRGRQDGSGIATEPLKASAQLSELKPDPTPLGYLTFCLNYADQCKTVAGRKRVALNGQAWATLNDVNREINDRIAPDDSKGQYDWSLTTTSGNCNDYAVQKRKKLIERGIPASAISLSVVITPENVGHLVVTVRTDRGDFVLDNLRGSIVSWNSTGYRWIRVQSNADPNQWVKVGPA